MPRRPHLSVFSSQRRLTCLGGWLALALAGVASARAADLLAHDLNSFAGYPVVDGEKAYSAGAVWCNLSDQNLSWDANTNQHPISVLNLYRVENGLMMQIGASWATHQFCALQLNNCGSCTPAGAGCPFALGVGCSTNSTGSSLGFQGNMSKRSDVDAAEGSFPFPFSNPPVSSSLDRRCRVTVDDVDPALHPTATYFFELVTLHPTPGDQSERCVVRKVMTNAALLGTPLANGPALEGTTAGELWTELVGDATLVPIDRPDDGRLLVGAHWQKLPSGEWRYDYVIQNLDSSDGARRIAIPLGDGVDARSILFHAPLAHSGEVTSNEPWTVEQSPRELAWSTASAAEDPLANAVRWGTTYTFSFVSSRLPTLATVTVGLFQSGESVAVSLPAPKPLPGPLAADLNEDGAVNATDLSILLGLWGGYCPRLCPADLSEDQFVDSADLAILLGAWTG